MISHSEGALAWWDAGMTVVPVRKDGSKRPAFDTWKEFQVKRPRRDLTAKWWDLEPEHGVGIICGQASGNLEMLEIEAVRMSSEWLLQIDDLMGRDQKLYDLWSTLSCTNWGYTESTPSGGMHILYRVSDQPVPGNQKIAMSRNSKTTYAETRGEGGFVVVAPSSGTVHKSGDSWSVLTGEIGVVPTITWEERCAIHAVLKEALDERVLPVYERPEGMAAYDRSRGDRPGDAFNDDPSVTIGDILTRNGWKYLGTKRGQEEYVHPNSSDMTTGSARTGHNGLPGLYVWSGMPQEGSYSKFAVLTHLEYGGDFSAASRALRGQGYGSQTKDVGWDELVEGFEVAARVPVQSVLPASEVSAVAEGNSPPTADDAPLSLEEYTETGVAHFMKKLVGTNFRYVQEEKTFRIYRDGRWCADDRSATVQAVEKVAGIVRKHAVKVLDEAKLGGDREEITEARKLVSFGTSCRSARGVQAIATRFSQQQGIATVSSDFDQNLNLVALSNGTLNLETLTFREHRSDDMLSKRIDVTYDRDASCPRWLRFLEEVIPDPAIREFVQDAVGMTLLGRMEEAAFFLLHGDSGCGKSQFMKVIEAVMGEYAATATSSVFRTSRWGDKATTDLHNLKGSRFVSTSETSEGTMLDEELIKRITGGDPVTSRALYENNVTWKPRFTMWMATNHPPRLNSDDNAIWRRVRPIQFPNSFYQDGRTAEPGLAEKMIASELAGIFNWVLEGAQRYLSRGLKQPELITSAVKEYRNEVDPVQIFLSEAADEGRVYVDSSSTELEMKSSELYRVYSAWCSDNSLRPVAERRFSMRLSALGYDTRKGSGGVRMRRGIQLNPQFGVAAAQKSASDGWWKG